MNVFGTSIDLDTGIITTGLGDFKKFFSFFKCYRYWGFLTEYHNRIETEQL